MERAYNSNRIRITSGIMAVMMLVVILVSSFFIAAHTDHDCTGEDCPICACIQQCENTIRRIGSGITAESAVIIPVLISLLIISFCVPSFQRDTPVSAKVRLNN
ncbi:MAG: hypothetical protein K6E53_08170 [Lachnospiraceae bacterium]|nr:hypothetical protein [Lachnospiraceae bacterium]